MLPGRALSLKARGQELVEHRLRASGTEVQFSYDCRGIARRQTEQRTRRHRRRHFLSTVLFKVRDGLTVKWIFAGRRTDRTRERWRKVFCTTISLGSADRLCSGNGRAVRRRLLTTPFGSLAVPAFGQHFCAPFSRPEHRDPERRSLLLQRTMYLPGTRTFSPRRTHSLHVSVRSRHLPGAAAAEPVRVCR